MEQQSGEHSKRASATKRGPGRYGQHGKPGNRTSKARPVRAYKALMDAWASRRATKAALHDEHGAVTLVGSVYEMEGENLQPTSREYLFGGSVGPGGSGHTQYTARRIWLAGISAQRGY